jgi:hypothetical protein
MRVGLELGWKALAVCALTACGGNLGGAEPSAAGSSSASGDGAGSSDGAAGAGAGPYGGEGGAAAGGGSSSTSSASGGAFMGGAPIAIPEEAPYDTWTWVDFPDTQCANGSPTGMGINPHATSNKLFIYLAGGGVCWSYETCIESPTAYGLDGYGGNEFPDTAMYELSGGVFSRSDPENPLRDYNFVFIPYCTGDLHMGSRVTDYGGETIRHVGHDNVAAFLQRIVPTFSGIEQVVVSGVSAGGFGATWNYQQTWQAFQSLPSAPEVQLISDSGPYLRAPYYSVELQQAYETSFGASENMPGCTDCDPFGPGDGFFNVVPHLAATVPGFRGSLICSTRDYSVSSVLSLPPGDPALLCDASLPDGGPCAFEPGLSDLYTEVIGPAGPGRFEVFYIDSYDHVWLGQEPASIYSGGVTLAQFMSDQLGGSAGWSSVLP